MLVGLRSVVLALVVATVARADPVEVLASIEAGDLRAAYRGLVAGYQAAGAEIPPWIELREQSAFEPLSTWNGAGAITQSRLLGPDQGLEYWRGWSSRLTGGRWDPDSALGGEVAARRLGNFSLVGILAHELGHAIADLEGVGPEARPARELVADELAVRLMRSWSAPPALVALRDAYRDRICGDLWAAVPEPTRRGPPGAGTAPPRLAALRAWVAGLELPDDLPVAGYVSLQLARQAALLADPELSPLEAYLAELRATLPSRRWYRPRIALCTLPEDEVPDWVREAAGDGPPALLSAAGLTALTASLGVAALDPAPVRGRLMWKAAGPGRTMALLHDPGLWPEAPARLVRLDASPGGADWIARVLGSGPVALWRGVGLVPDGSDAALVSLARGPGGIRLRSWVAEAASGRLVPGPLDGLPVTGAAVPDGPLYALPLPRDPRGLAFDGARAFLSTGGSIRVAEGGALWTLAGGLPTYADGEDPAKVRLAAAEILALGPDRLWLSTRGPSGRVYRSLAW